MQKAEQERAALLDQLIRQMLLVETALTLKIEITEAEVEQYLQKLQRPVQDRDRSGTCSSVKKGRLHPDVFSVNKPNAT